MVTRSHEITDRKPLEEKLQQLATTDELTGCANRRRFLELARAEITRSARLKHPLALAIIDMDHLKQINDTHGHAAGDQALVVFTKICRKSIREIDLLARIGGDEFALLLPQTNSTQAYEVLEGVRQALAAMPLDLGGSQALVTISAGITDLTDEIEPLDTLLGNADQALYQAKEMGRNRVVVWDASRQSPTLAAP
jgi:diguanylate cyclase (GGDEF)-like protein